MAYCKVWFCTSPGHWVKAKALKWCSSPGHWSTAKGIWYRQTTTWARHCAFVKPTVGAVASHTVTVGQKATWAATAVNYDTLTWQYWNKHTWINIGSHGLTFESGAYGLGHTGYKYRLVASNAWGTTAGAAGTITVHQIAKPTISHIANITLNAFGAFAFRATVRGATTWQWWAQKGIGGTGAWVKFGAVKAATAAGTVSTWQMDGWKFKLVASNAEGTITSNIATLVVHPALSVLSITSKRRSPWQFTIRFNQRVRVKNSAQLRVRFPSEGNRTVLVANLAVESTDPTKIHGTIKYDKIDTGTHVDFDFRAGAIADLHGGGIVTIKASSTYA